MDGLPKTKRPPADFCRLIGTAVVLWALIQGGAAVAGWCVREAPPQVLIPAAAVLLVGAALGFLLGAVNAVGGWLRTIIRVPPHTRG